MSTTNKPTWLLAERFRDVPAIEEAITNFAHDQTGDNATGIVLAVLEHYAATEAAKATGTAGEQSTLIGMEVSMDVSTGDEDFDHRIFGRIEGLMAKGDGTDIILAVEESRNFATDTQAARQPAPVAIKTWQERMKTTKLTWKTGDGKLIAEYQLMTEEIADLRAALAATAAPVVANFSISEAQKNVIRRAADALEGLDYEDLAGDLRAVIPFSKGQPCSS